jgi:hypothetical protein
MFPPNEEEHKLESVSLKFNLNDLNIRLPLHIKYTSEGGQVGEVSRSTATDGTLSLGTNFNRFSPFGKWEITIDRERVPDHLLYKNDQVNPVMVSSEDKNNENQRLNTEKITNLTIGLCYEAQLEWPSQD